MRRHGYKGAFELAATVDYLFGYDATTGVVADWMYDKLAQSYLLDPENRAFLQEANPGRCTAWRSGSWRPRAAGCGPSPTRRCWPRYGSCSWRPRATWRPTRTSAG
ncbi:cobaltochelatase subunit CobN [Streptomyces sp. M19]